ncbi:MAG: zeta toxin family protein [Hyphomonadaceae bacterium]
MAKQLAPQWINPDTAPGTGQIAKGRWAIGEARRRLSNHDDIALETTLSGKWTFALVQSALSAGYSLEMHFIALSSAALGAERIKSRVEQGGHDVPLEEQQRRFPRAFYNAAELAKSCDLIALYDNSGDFREGHEHRMIAKRTRGRRAYYAPACPPWARLILTGKL